MSLIFDKINQAKEIVFSKDTLLLLIFGIILFLICIWYDFKFGFLKNK